MRRSSFAWVTRVVAMLGQRVATLGLPGASLAAVGALTALGVVAPAHASISTAATLDGLVKGAHVVALAEPVEARTEWVDGRIVTYTKLHVVEKVSGEAPADVWVKSLGGMVGDIGQSVEGEPIFVKGTRSLVFLRRASAIKGVPDAHIVVSRAQGQFPLAKDQARWMVRANARPGTILPPKEDPTTPAVVPLKVAAIEHLKDRPIDDVMTEVRTVWAQLHATKSP